MVLWLVPIIAARSLWESAAETLAAHKPGRRTPRLVGWLLDGWFVFIAPFFVSLSGSRYEPLLLLDAESRSGITDHLGEPASFRAEVIVHELLHLKIPNHGKLFKALLKAHLADAG
jgi:hypothetical protein